jgi:micrococcal nuclease
LETYNFEAYCTNVVDGDTADLVIDVGFRMTTEQRVRLLGINTPERGHEGYQAAKDYLKERILDKLMIVQTRKSDAFGRYLATVYVDGQNINEELLSLGLAVPYVK